jgi:hypothetical protein
MAVCKHPVRAKIASRILEINLCGHFPVRAAIIQSVRTLWRSVRANFPSVRAKIHLCGHFSICARKKPNFGRFWRIRMVKKRQLNPYSSVQIAP